MRARGFWLHSLLALVLAVSAAMTPARRAVAGDFSGEWFVIGTDADPPLYDQRNASIAFNSDRGEYLVVWHNERPVYPDIQAQRVSADGGLVGVPFYIAGGPGFQRRLPGGLG